MDEAELEEYEEDDLYYEDKYFSDDVDFESEDDPLNGFSLN